MGALPLGMQICSSCPQLRKTGKGGHWKLLKLGGERNRRKKQNLHITEKRWFIVGYATSHTWNLLMKLNCGYSVTSVQLGVTLFVWAWTLEISHRITFTVRSVRINFIFFWACFWHGYSCLFVICASFVTCWMYDYIGVSWIGVNIVLFNKKTCRVQNVMHVTKFSVWISFRVLQGRGNIIFKLVGVGHLIPSTSLGVVFF